MTDESATNPVTALFRDPAPRPVARLLLSLVAAAVATALALFGAWCWAAAVPRVYQYNQSGTLVTRTVNHVSDEMLAISFILVGELWLAALWFIWAFSARFRPYLAAILVTLGAWALPVLGAVAADVFRFAGGREEFGALGGALAAIVLSVVSWTVALTRTRMGMHSPVLRRALLRIVVSIGIIGVTTAAAVAVDLLVRDEEEYLIAAVIVLGAALLFAAWIPIAVSGVRTRVVGGEGIVNVHCPHCGYSLVGLTELRCPECGARFTLDEVIAAQRYAESVIHDGRS